MLDFRSVAREDGEGQENPDQPQTFEQILTSEIKSGICSADLTLVSMNVSNVAC